MSLIEMPKWSSLEYKKAEQYLCQTNLKYLCTNILGFSDWDTCHDDFAAWKTGNFNLIMMPRGHLKTSIISIAKTIQDILINPNVRILLDTAVWDNARSFLREISEHLRHNRKLTDLFGRFEDPNRQFNSEEITIRQRTLPSKTPTISTAGIEKTLTSQHYDIIRADDLVTRENITTSDQMEKVKNHFKDLIKLLEPNGRMEIVGTRWHDGDLYGHISRELCDEKLGVDKFHVYLRRAMEDGKVIFQKKFSEQKLAVIKAQIGSYEYSANYENNPINPENQKFKPPIRYWKELDETFEHYITVDPAISEKKGSCDAVVIDAAINGANQLCAVEYTAFQENDKLPSKVIEKIFEYVLKYPNRSKSKTVGIESNGYQAVLARLLAEEQKKRNIFFNIVEIRQNKDKNMRILELTPRWESGNLLLKPGMTELEDQILRFPVATKVDILDALAMMLQIIQPKYESRPKVWIPPVYRAA